MDSLFTNVFSPISEYSSCTFLPDSSVSVSDKDFVLAKSTIKCFAEKLCPKLEKRIINFSSDITSTPFTSDPKEFFDSIEKLEHKKGCTNFQPAITEAHNGIKFRSYGKHLVIIITDGVPSDQPQKVIDKLLKENVNVYIIAVGNSDDAFLKKMFGSKFVFKVSNFEYLNKIVQDFVPKKLPFITNIYSGSETYQKSTEPFLIDVAFRLVKVDVEINKDEIKIEFLENDYYSGNTYIMKEPLEYDVEKYINIKLHPQQNSQNFNVPGEINFIVHYKDKIYPGIFAIDFAWFFGDLMSDTDINFCMNGCIGAGKSTLNQSFSNLHTGGCNIIDNLLKTSNVTDMHCTEHFTQCPMSTILKNCNLLTSTLRRDIYENLRLQFFDKWGLTAKNKDSFNIIHAAEGRYKLNMHMGDIVDSRNLPNNPDNAIHCFINVFPMRSILFEEETNLMISNLKDCMKAGIAPLVVVNMYDDLDDQEVADLTKKIKDKLPVEEGNLFFVIPYINAKTIRCPKKDSTLFTILKRGVSIAKGTIRQQTMTSDPDDNLTPAKRREIAAKKIEDEKKNQVEELKIEKLNLENQHSILSNVNVGVGVQIIEEVVVGENKSELLKINCCMDGETFQVSLMESSTYVELRNTLSDEFDFNQNDYIFKYGKELISKQPIPLLKSGIDFKNDILTITKKTCKK